MDAEAQVSAARGTNLCMTICNIIIKAALCFIQPISVSPLYDGKVEGGNSGVAGALAECVTHQSLRPKHSVWIAVFG